MVKLTFLHRKGIKEYIFGLGADKKYSEIALKKLQMSLVFSRKISLANTQALGASRHSFWVFNIILEERKFLSSIWVVAQLCSSFSLGAMTKNVSLL